MEKLPENIDVFTTSVADFGNANIVFSEDDGVITFQVIADEEWYLCSDNKFREDPDLAANFGIHKFHKGKIVKKYDSILLRAGEAIGYVLAGYFTKVSV